VKNYGLWKVAYAKMDSGGNKLYLSDVCVMRKVDSEQTLETNEPASSSKEGYVLDLLCCTT
jgi:hypothetical protein